MLDSFVPILKLQGVWESASHVPLIIDETLGSDFVGQRWKDRQLEFLKIAKEGKSPRFTSLLKYDAYINNKVLVDIGGGSGWMYYYLISQSVLPLKYICVEIESVVNFFSKYITDPKVVYTTLKSLTPENDLILYSNSAAQYIDDNAFFTIIKEGTEVIILDDFICTNGQEFWSLQITSRGQEMFFVRNFQKFINDINNIGFSLKGFSKNKMYVNLNDNYSNEIFSYNLFLKYEDFEKKDKQD